MASSTQAERRSLLDWVIRPALRSLPGVADVNSLGGLVRVFEVVPDNAALRARGIRLSQLRQALEANNRNDGAGRLADGEESLLVRIEGSAKTLDDIRAIVATSAMASRARRRCSPRTRRQPDALRRGHHAAARARPSRAWCWACAGPTRGRW